MFKREPVNHPRAALGRGRISKKQRDYRGGKAFLLICVLVGNIFNRADGCLAVTVVSPALAQA
jgi:hypothetical protein